MDSHFHTPQPPRPDDDGTPSFLLPAGVTMPLWRSLLLNLRDRMQPGNLPPLHLTSQPVDVGMLVGDIVDLPWYRTVFTNVGDVISPETSPPLQLESHPVDVGELVSDQIQRGWWSSALRNLVDNLVPEQMPPLHLTSVPVIPPADSHLLVVPRWSALITLPRRDPGDRLLQPPVPPRPAAAAAPTASPTAGNTLRKKNVADPSHELADRTRRAIQRAHWREAVWISLAAAEAVFLVLWQFVLK
jgi:hypothetical protein